MKLTLCVRGMKRQVNLKSEVLKARERKETAAFTFSPARPESVLKEHMNVSKQWEGKIPARQLPCSSFTFH